MSETSWADRLGSAATSTLAGVAGGAMLGPPGMIVGGLVGLARSLTSQPHADDEAPALQQVAQALTGVADPVQQVAALQADPVKADEFRVAALRIRAEAQTARDAHMLALVQAANEDRAGARAAAAVQTGVLRYATLGVSLFILGLWASIMVASIFGHTPNPPITDDMATLRNLAIAVVAFWVGSSASSRGKDEVIADSRAKR